MSEERNKLEPNPEPAKIPELPAIELGEGERDKISKRMMKMLEYSKNGKAPTILPSPTPIPKDKIVELAKNCLNSLLTTQLSETGENTYTDWFEISIVGIRERVDRYAYAYEYWIDFCVTMDYFFESDYKDYYRVTMADWGKVVEIELKRSKRKHSRV